MFNYLISTLLWCLVLLSFIVDNVWFTITCVFVGIVYLFVQFALLVLTIREDRKLDREIKDYIIRIIRKNG